MVASSDKAYGDHETLPYDEDAPLQGRHPYDVSKSCADLIAQAYATTYGLPVAITRCGNFYGGGDLNWNRIVPGTIRSVLRGQRPIIRSDGQFVRDYFYVEDGAAAYMLLAERLAQDPCARGRGVQLLERDSRSRCSSSSSASCALMGSDLEPDRAEPGDDTRSAISTSIRAEGATDARLAARVHARRRPARATVAWYAEFLAGAVSMTLPSDGLPLVRRAAAPRAVLSLGETPLANALLAPDDLTRPEPTYPARRSCSVRTCTLVQITETVPPEVLFCDYLYFSSFSDTMLRTCRGDLATD